MSEESRSPSLKSAYELALERLDAEGIGRPDENALSSEAREAVAEQRRRAEASLAELEIMHHKKLAETFDPAERARVEDEYIVDRRRIKDRRDRDIDRLRRPADGSGSAQS